MTTHYSYEINILTVLLRSPEVEMFSRKGGTAQPTALTGPASDDGRRVSRLACCYHAMTVGHDGLQDDDHQMAASCYSDQNLRNDSPLGDVDAWRQPTPGLNVRATACSGKDVPVALPELVE